MGEAMSKRTDRAYLVVQKKAIQAKLDEFPAPDAKTTVKLETALSEIIEKLEKGES
jgi:hypothetical protein